MVLLAVGLMELGSNTLGWGGLAVVVLDMGPPMGPERSDDGKAGCW